MGAIYPKPDTPLPWDSAGIGVNDAIPPECAASFLSDADDAYIVHAANAFPHLVAALEMIQAAQRLRPAQRQHVANALAIARGETTP